MVFTLFFYNLNVNTFMFISIEEQTLSYTRISKLGHPHDYSRSRRYAVFRCDSCGEIFQRLKGSVDSKRLSNNYFHCCNGCDPKRFAQKKGVERRHIWDMPASSMADISRL
jgi:hypothetical protein